MSYLNQLARHRCAADPDLIIARSKQWVQPGPERHLL
jgi:hypothetical protein